MTKKTPPTYERFTKGGIKRRPGREGYDYIVESPFDWLANKKLLGKGRSGQRRYLVACSWYDMWLKYNSRANSGGNYEKLLVGHIAYDTGQIHYGRLKCLYDNHEYLELRDSIDRYSFYGHDGLNILDRTCQGDFPRVRGQGRVWTMQRHESGRILKSTLDFLSDMMSLY